MLLRIYVILFSFTGFLLHSQITDAQNLTKDIEALMYSDPDKALKTAQYILSNQSFGSADDVYNAALLQAEIFINQRKYSDAVLKLIVADRLSATVQRNFYLLKNEYLLSKIYLALGFDDNIGFALEEFDEKAKALKNQEKQCADLWRVELEILRSIYNRNSQKSLALINAYVMKTSEFDSKFGMRLLVLKSEIENVPMRDVSGKDDTYFQFLSQLMRLERALKEKKLDPFSVSRLRRDFPQFGDIFYKDIYSAWSQQICTTPQSAECFKIRKDYINILRSTLSDVQRARVDIVNLVDQKERHRNIEQKTFQNKVLWAIFIFAFLAVAAYLIYYFVLRNRAAMIHAELEKQVLYKEYEQKLSDQRKDFQASNAFTIPEKTENMILAKLETFEKSNEVTNPHLSLAVLAKRLDTNSKYLSEIINKHKQKNFNHYLNELKVNYIIDKLKHNPEYLQYKTSYLAEEAGFASRTAFTTIFKSVTGKSPSQFITELKNAEE